MLRRERRGERADARQRREIQIQVVIQIIAGIVLGIAMLVLRGGLLKLATVLGLLFAIASLLALVLALTVGLFGITEVWSFTLVPETVVVDSIAVVILAITSIVVLRQRQVA